VLLKSIATVFFSLGIVLLSGCTRQPSDQTVTHETAAPGSGPWLRSDFDIVGRVVKEFNDHSGDYVVLTIKHGDKVITTECGMTWRSSIGEEFPSTPAFDNCADLPMGPVMLERTDWNDLYYFAGKGKNTEEITLHVKKIETR
jgi:hypothetical protein